MSEEEETLRGTEGASEESVELPRGLSTSFEAGSVDLLKLSIAEDVFPKLPESACPGLERTGALRGRDGSKEARTEEQVTKCPATPYPWKVSTPVWGSMFSADFQLKLPLSDIESSPEDASSVFGARPQSRYVISEEWIHETTEDFGSNCSVISGSMRLPKFHRSNYSPMSDSMQVAGPGRSNSLPTLRRLCRETHGRRAGSV